MPAGGTKPGTDAAAGSNPIDIAKVEKDSKPGIPSLGGTNAGSPKGGGGKKFGSTASQEPSGPNAIAPSCIIAGLTIGTPPGPNIIASFKTGG